MPSHNQDLDTINEFDMLDGFVSGKRPKAPELQPEAPLAAVSLTPVATQPKATPSKPQSKTPEESGSLTPQAPQQSTSEDKVEVDPNASLSMTPDAPKDPSATLSQADVAGLTPTIKEAATISVQDDATGETHDVDKNIFDTVWGTFSRGAENRAGDEFITDVAEDNVDILGNIPAIASQGFLRGSWSTELAAIHYEEMTGNGTEESRARAAELQKQLSVPGIKPESFWEKGVAVNAEQLPLLMGMMYTGVIRGGEAALVPLTIAAAATIASPVTGGASLVIARAMVRKAVPMMGVGMAFGQIEYLVKQEAGSFYAEAQKIRGHDGQPLNEDVVLFVAHAVGLVSALGERFALGKLFKLFPGGSKLMPKLFKGTPGSKRMITLPRGRNALFKFVRDVNAYVMTEVLIEAGQAAVNDAGKDLAKWFSDGEFEYDPFDTRVDNMINSAEQALYGAALLGPTVGLTKVPSDIRNSRIENNKNGPQHKVKDLSDETLEEVLTEFAGAEAAPNKAETVRVSGLTPEMIQTLNYSNMDVQEDGTMPILSAHILVAEFNRRAEANTQTAPVVEHPVYKLVRKGRIKEADAEIYLIDQDLINLEKAAKERREKKLSTKQVEKDIARNLAKRDKLDEERAGLLTFEGAEQANAEGLLAGEGNIKIKGSKVLELDRRNKKETTRLVEVEFRKGVRVARKDMKEAQRIFVQTLDASKLSDKDKQKFTKRILNTTNVDQLRKSAPVIMERISQLETAERRRSANATIKDVLLNKTVVKDKTARLDLDTQKVMDLARSAYTMDTSDATARRDEIDAMDSPSAILMLERAVLGARLDVGKPESAKDTSINVLEDLADTLLDGVELGRFNLKNTLAARAVASEKLKRRFIDGIIGPDKERTTRQEERAQKRSDRVARWGLGWTGNFENLLLHALNDTDSARTNALTRDLGLFSESRVFDDNKRETAKKLDEVMQEATERKSSRSVRRWVRRSEKERINLPKMVHAGETRARSVDVRTRAEARARVLQFRNEDTRNSMMGKESGNKYTEDIISAIENSLTETDVRVVDAQLKFYAEYHARIAAVYERVQGVPLTHITNYSPTSRVVDENGNIDHVESFIQQGGGVGGSALKERTQNSRTMSVASDMQTLASHTQQMEYYIAFAEKVQSLTTLLNDDTVMSEIKERSGSEILTQLKNHLAFFSQRGEIDSMVGGKFFNVLIKNVTMSALALKPQIGIKQLISVFAYAENVSSLDFADGVAAFMSDPIAAIKFMNANSSLVANRGYNLDRDFQEALAGSFPGPVLSKILMINIKLGDKGAILIGGYAQIHANMKKGMSLKDAVSEMERSTVRTQQSPDVDQQSSLQQKRNPLTRMFTQFGSSAAAIARAEVRLIQDVRAGRITATKGLKQGIKTLLIYHVIIPQLMQIAANAGSFDEDDQTRAAIMGPLNGLFIAGDVIEAVVGFALKLQVYGSGVDNPLENLQDVALTTSEVLDDLIEGDVRVEDLLDASSSLSKAVKAGATVTGLPSGAISIASGLIQFPGSRSNLESEENFLRILGYSEYAIANRNN